MNLIQMSILGGVLILAVIVLRALALNKLPKGTFLALWAVAALRLLFPFSIPSPASVYNLADIVETPAAVPAAQVSPLPAMDFTPSAVPAAPAALPSPAPEAGTAVDPWLLAWIVGMIACGVFFLVSYLRCRREFRTALPVENTELRVWLEDQRLRRTVSIRQSDRVDAPLTYGLLRPVILLPRNWEQEPQLNYVLTHELAHVRHLDALWKLALAFTACVHWFNPLVWCMFVLANRDMELRCDEAVIRHLGLDSRSGYARALISLEEKKSGLGPFASAFSKNAIEERIIAIMKIKKRSLAAILAAVVLVCCVGVGFATSAAGKSDAPYPQVQDGTFTKAELDRLSELWFEGYGDMTVAAYQQKMWIEFDTPEDIALIDRYGQYSVTGSFFDDPEATTKVNAFYDYFYSVYEPLTAERWQERMFMGATGIKGADGNLVFVEYTYTMRILDAETLTAGEYQQAIAAVKPGVQALLKSGDVLQEDFHALAQRLSSDALTVTIEAGLPLRDYGPAMDTDAELHAQSSRETAAEWERLLTPYTVFGLTYQFDDPDLDGNGLTMWWGGKEVRGIYDETEGIWITEHTGTGFSEGAVELYAVYTDGVLSGLREADPDDQAAFDEIRRNNHAALDAPSTKEVRGYPRATLEDYDALMTLRQRDDESLKTFNQRLLDWANENPDAWNRINCDILWNDFDEELTTDAKTFASVTCYFSGIENGQTVRALYTGEPEQDPYLSAAMPMRSNEENGIVNAWCDLYYILSYHVADKSVVTARERDAVVGGMMNAINTFWQDTDLDTLLQMTEADIVAQFNAWAVENSTENVKINPITADNIYFQPYDERGID